MSAGRLVSEAPGSPAATGTTDTFAVALVGEEDRGWLVDATTAGEARAIVHGTVPRAHEVWRAELLVWLASDYRARHLGGAPFPDSWIRLPRQCPACGKGWLVDPGGVDAGLRCMIEVDVDESGFVLEAGCGYRPAADGPGLD